MMCWRKALSHCFFWIILQPVISIPPLRRASFQGSQLDANAPGCALIGGETAEMPGLYADGDYDIAGFCVGAVERENVLPKAAVAGDILIAIGSSGPHANGYSLIRKIIDDHALSLNSAAPFDPDRFLGEVLLEPTRIYVQSVLPLLRWTQTRGFAHITGGGLIDNIPRALPDNLAPRISVAPADMPPVFSWLQDAGALSDAELHRTFNCGIGAVLIIAPGSCDAAIDNLKNAGESAWILGDVATIRLTGCQCVNRHFRPKIPCGLAF